MNFFFALTVFLSAFLLFYCEPMVGKMVLPFLGGAPSVWTACMLFFQAMLLLGYAYAYTLEKLWRVRAQLFVHLLLMLAVIRFLPIHFGDAGKIAPKIEYPALWLLARLVVVAAIPFGITVTSAPLLQNWMSKTSGASARDPYFLYAASNAGSLLALVTYPLFIEPRLGVMDQSRAWSAGYLALVCAVTIAAAVVWGHTENQTPLFTTANDTGAPSWKRRAFWLAAAFVPSALMLAVTNHISANLVAAPFLWVIPLAVYLLTFMLAFAPSGRLTLARVSSAVPIIFLLSPYVTAGAPVPAGLIWIVLPAHIAILFSGALLCHTSLAASRPDPRHLTDFYFWIGGALAGVFAVVVAPALFSTVFEYPLLVATLGFFRASLPTEERDRKDYLYPAAIGVLIIVGWIVLHVSQTPDVQEGTAVLLVNGGFVLIYGFRKRRLRFALALVVFVIGAALILPSYLENGRRLYVARNFFGVKKVLFDAGLNARKLLHGDTIHGVESVEEGKSGIPLSYYHPTGPAGDVMEMIKDRRDQNVGIVGLGTGSLAAYASWHRHITFFDLDPQIIDIAQTYFSYLRRCAANCTVVVGDGRVRISQLSEGTFDLLVIDAFSSDSIPSHLVSREAVGLYVSRLKPDGVLLFHVSNRFLDIPLLVSAVLTDSGLATFVRHDTDRSIAGKSPSDYVVAARKPDDLGSITSNPNWQRVSRIPDLRPWTDDYSNVIGLLRWR